MKEIERQTIVYTIKKFLKEKETLKEKEQYLEVLLKNPVVIEYLDLLKEIEDTKRKHERFTDIEYVIRLHFFWAMNKIRDIGISCNHDIWIYDSSFSFYEDPYYEHDHTWRCENEKDKDFCYNRYVCLECQNAVEAKDWKKFEETHYVLKNKNCYHGKRYAEDYCNLYYQLLFSNKVSVAREKVMEAFNKDCEIDKEKVKVKK